MFGVRCLIVGVKVSTSTIRHQTSRLFSVALLMGTFSVWVDAAETPSDESPFHRATRLYQEAEWQQAATAFAASVEASSANKQNDELYLAAHFYQGECLMQLGDFSKAREHYRIVLDQASAGPYARRALFRAGESSWFARDADSAQPLLQNFVREYPHDALAAYALTYLGEISLLEGDPERSVTAYRTVIDSFAHTSQVNQARLGLAKSLLALGRTDDIPLALGRLTQEKNSPLAAEAILLLGRSYYEAGEYDTALKTFRRLPDSFPTHHLVSQAKLAAGWALWKLGVFDKVAAELASLANDSRWTVDTHYLVGMAKYGQDDWPAAIEQLTLALEGAEKHPGRDAILFYLGENCLRAGQPQAAVNWFQALSNQHPRSRWADDALWGIARVAHREHEVDNFQAAVAQLRDRFPTSRYLDRLQQLQTGEEEYLALPYENELLDEAAGLQRDGRFDAALAAYHELLDQNRIGRTHSETLRRAAQLHNQLAQFPEASRLFQEFLAQYPDSVHAAEVISAQAWLGVQTDDLAVAGTKFQELYEKFPQSAQALEAAYWLATAAADREDDAQATLYTDWLLARLSKLAEGRPKTLWEQTLLLKCQLSAADNQWQEIKDLLAREEEQFDEQFDEGPRKARASFWFAEAEFRVGRPSEALALFDQLTEQTKDLQEPWIAMVPLRRAQLRSRRQQWTEVLKILNETGDFRPEVGEKGSRRSAYPSTRLEASGGQEKLNSRTVLGRAVKPAVSFPLQYEVDYLRGRAHAGLGEMTLARRNYRRVLNNETAKQTTTATMAQWMIGETFFHQNDYPRARLAYRKVIAQHSQPEWQARAALQAGKCWELEQNWEQARDVYADALQQWQGSESATQLQARWKWAASQATQRR